MQSVVFSSILLLFVCGLQVVQAQVDNLDPDGDRLIDITTTSQLNAIRYDLDGNGYADNASQSDLYGNAGGTAGLFNITGRISSTSYYEGYELASSLNFATSAWAEGVSAAGWPPIGSSSTPYTATFDGNGHKISNMYINISGGGNAYAGLFSHVSSTAIIKDVGMVDVDITTTGPSFSIAGGLVGDNQGGMISGSYATGPLSSTPSHSDINLGYSSGSSSSGSSSYAGGLVGRNSGTINDSYATGDVSSSSSSSSVSSSNYSSVSSSTSHAGGLVGSNSGTISGSYATGDVSSSSVSSSSTSIGFSSSGSSSYAGGLVGDNSGTISGSYAMGAFSSSSSSSRSGAGGGSSSNSSYAGGLVGDNSGTISGSYATGSSSSNFYPYYAGGLVGENASGGSIVACYATGDILRARSAGGLVGSNGGTISGSYATGSVSSSSAGGLVSVNGSGANIVACYATGDIPTSTDAGGLVDTNAGRIVACYATGDVSATTAGEGLVRTNTGQIIDSYYTSTANIEGTPRYTEYEQEALEMVKTTDYGDDDSLYPESTWNVDVDNADTDDDLVTGEDDPWDFGNSAQYPALKGIDVNQDGSIDNVDLALQRAELAPRFLQTSYEFDSSPSARRSRYRTRHHRLLRGTHLRNHSC